MSIIYEQLNSLSHESRIRTVAYIAKVVCDEAAGNTMKFVRPEELLGRAFSLVAFYGLNDERQIVGHVSVDDEIVGALWTHKSYRGMGIAQKLVFDATDFQLRRSVRPIAFCNPKSVGVFAKYGYAVAESDRTDRTKMIGPETLEGLYEAMALRRLVTV